MKLLIITQKVDIDDPILGFFHRWIEEFSKNYEKLIVICLQKGKFNLPKNVEVLSLGKENKFSKIRYIINFYKYIFLKRKDYDAVFVHMNQEYVLLGGLFWKIFGKKIYMWRNHYAGNVLTDLSSIFCSKVFCTSKSSYTAKYKKTVLMPVGIDTDLFKKDDMVIRKENTILSLGRIAPSKKIDLLIKALALIKDEAPFSLSIYGDPVPKDEFYLSFLKKIVKDNSLENRIHFYGSVPNHKTPQIYSLHEIFVNLSPSGMYDKTIFEAMACGCIALTSNNNLFGVVSDSYLFNDGNLKQLADKIIKIFGFCEESKIADRKIFRGFAEKNSLKTLGEKFIEIIK